MIWPTWPKIWTWTKKFMKGTINKNKSVPLNRKRMSLGTQGVKQKEEAYQFGKRYVKNRGKFSEVKPAKNKKYDVVDSTDRIAYAVQTNILSE